MILKNLGEAYQMSGQNREAISVLELALKQDADDKSALFLVGLSYENLEQYEKAISIFERLTSFKPVENAVYYHLGLSYGRQDKLALAHYNFGLYFKRLGQIQKARFHFRKAHSLSENDPALRKKILKEIEEKPHYGR
jgi:tetratricopeptide (TPR) repeat protein